MRKYFAAAALGLLSASIAETSPEIVLQSEAIVLQSELIFTAAPFPSCHASTIVETASGALLAAWFGGTDEGRNDVEIWISRKQGDGWSPPRSVADGLISDSERYPTWNPVLFQPSLADGGEGPILLFYKVGRSPQTWWGEWKKSHDDGTTWTPAERLPDGILGPIRAKPIQLPNDTMLAGSSTEHDGWRVHFERTSDLGQSWQSTGPIHDGKTFGAIQPTLLLHPDGRLQALCRSRQQRITETWSNDGGLSWSSLRATSLPNPSAGIDSLALADGRMLLVYNHTSSREGERPADGTRSELNLAISDDGVDWRAALLLERRPGEFSYPAMIQGRNGRIHLSYTHRRRQIKYVEIDPAELRGHQMAGGRWPESAPSAPGAAP